MCFFYFGTHLTLEFRWGDFGLSDEYRVKTGGFFDNLKNIHNETFLIQILLVLSQLGVEKPIPNIMFAFKGRGLFFHQAGGKPHFFRRSTEIQN